MTRKSLERIEQEMSEIRSRMEPDVTDLREHIESQVVTNQVKQTLRQRLRGATDRSKVSLGAKRQEFAGSARSSFSRVRRKISDGREE